MDISPSAADGPNGAAPRVLGTTVRASRLSSQNPFGAPRAPGSHLGGPLGGPLGTVPVSAENERAALLGAAGCLDAWLKAHPTSIQQDEVPAPPSNLVLMRSTPTP